MNKNVIFFVFGIMLIVMATFAFADTSSVKNMATDFQVILAMGGLAAIIVGILRLE